MSHAATPVKTLSTRATQLGALLVTTGLVWAITRVAPEFHGPGGVIASVGFLLLAGMLTSELLETVGLPHLTGYLALGLVAGPHVLGFVDHVAVTRLESVNTLALTLIALAGGVELEWELLKSRLKSLLWANGLHSSILFVSMTAAFYFVASDLEFMRGLGPQHVLAVGTLWAVLAISRSPSATLAILAQTRPSGPLTRFALAFVMSSDVVVIILLSLVMSVVRPMFDASSDVSLAELVVLGHEILGSVTVGTSLGLGLALYLRLFGRQILLLILGLAYVAGEAIGYLRFDPLLTFLIAGFVVRNFSRQGPLLLSSVERTGSVVFVLFFATAGAHLDVPLLLRLWPTALLLCAARMVATFVAQAWASRQALDPPVVRRWGDRKSVV